MTNLMRLGQAAASGVSDSVVDAIQNLSASDLSLCKAASLAMQSGVNYARNSTVEKQVDHKNSGPQI